MEKDKPKSEFVLGQFNLLFNKHGITKAEEAVVFLDSVFVGVKDKFSAGKGRHQHDQGGHGQVEIGGEGIDNLELVTWFDEDIGPARIGLELAVKLVADGFKRSDRGCSDGDDTAASGLDSIDGLGGFFGKIVELGMHVVVVQIIHGDGTEGT